MMKNVAVIALLVLCQLTAAAQVDYARQYQGGKDFFRQGKYNLAMETFKPLIAYDQQNPYSPYASFYYALAAYRQGYKAVAKDMLVQIRTVHAKWDKMDDVHLWLGKIYFDNRDYFQALKSFNAIGDKKLARETDALKSQHLAEISDEETLRMLHEEFPKDAVVARFLARSLSAHLSDEENRKTLESLIERFRLERADFIPEAPSTFFKDRYAVSLLLPFMLESLDATPGKKRNQIVLDFYEGIRLAVDTLSKQGVSISLRAYDTDKGQAHLRRILQSEELKNTDLIIGPLFAEEAAIVQEFALQHQVNVVNPFSNNVDLIGTNPHAFLYQPSAETLGKKSAEFVVSQPRKKKTMIFYGTSNKDSVMAANFAARGSELGLEIVASQEVNGQDAARIITVLATPTEYDEFKYPSQFTLKKDSIGSIFVATDDPLIYTKVVSSVETRADSILVVGSENWIDNTAVPFEKYQTLGVALAAPNFAARNTEAWKIFMAQYVRAYGKAPSNVSQLGYELMLFFGNQLKKNGVYFQDGLHKEEFYPGYLSEGFRYQHSRDNQVVPFVKFMNGVLRVVQKQ